MAKAIWNEITAQDRSVILKHLREQYQGTCEVCGKDSEESEEAKAVYRKVISGPLKDCWYDIENFYSEMLDAVRIGMDPDDDMAKMIKKVLGLTDLLLPKELDEMIAAEVERLGLGSKDFMNRHKEIMDMCEAAQKIEKDGEVEEMKSGINSGVRKENFERGLQHGNKVYCAQDLRDLVGYRISDVVSDENDMDVVMSLEDGNKQLALYFDNLCLDGERISIVDYTEGSPDVLLRPVTEADLEEIANMTSYYDNDLVAEDNKQLGVNHIYCNNISLEGTDQFRIKDLYVFHDGRIMTGK